MEVEKRNLDVWVCKFADDTKGGKIIESTSDRDKMQEALNILYEWAETWGMSFNVSKCKVMHIGRHNPQYEYTMGGIKLGTTEEERDIGVAIAKNLKRQPNAVRRRAGQHQF